MGGSWTHQCLFLSGYNHLKFDIYNLSCVLVFKQNELSVMLARELVYMYICYKNLSLKLLSKQSFIQHCFILRSVQQINNFLDLIVCLILQ